MDLLLFLIQVFVVSFSGAVQPGPVTATAITMGSRNRWAGVLLAVGHGIIEFPMMALIILGVGTFLKSPAIQTTIGFVGGAVLLYMAFSMFKTAGNPGAARADTHKPIFAGIILTAGNPYFLIWWTTVGLALVTTAQSNNFAAWAFVLFAIVHWLVDLLWVTALSLASFHGKTLLGPARLKIILQLCAALMLGFGLLFIFNAGRFLLAAIT